MLLYRMSANTAPGAERALCRMADKAVQLRAAVVQLRAADEAGDFLAAGCNPEDITDKPPITSQFAMQDTNVVNCQRQRHISHSILLWLFLAGCKLHIKGLSVLKHIQVTEPRWPSNPTAVPWQQGSAMAAAARQHTVL